MIHDEEKNLEYAKTLFTNDHIYAFFGGRAKVHHAFRQACSQLTKVTLEVDGELMTGRFSARLTFDQRLLKKETEVPEEVIKAIGEAIGAASMCWDPPPKKQVFDTKRAQIVGQVLLSIIKEHMVSRELGDLR